MDTGQNTAPMRSFSFDGKRQPVSFVETLHVTNDVNCDVYAFDGDQTKDLGIIRIRPGGKTPLQKVLKGDKTIEGYISGTGKLIITQPDGKQKVYIADPKSPKPIVVTVGINEVMQWEADKESELTAYEICFPPYEDGRYENIK
jgi:hypothetical protein